MSLTLITIEIAAEDDVVRARQVARLVASGLGYAGQDQTRIATAVSEIARNAFTYAGGGKVTYAVEKDAARPALEIVVEDQGQGIAQLQAVLDGTYVFRNGTGSGIQAARRLMDETQIESTPGMGTRVALRKLLPRRAEPITPQTVADLSRRLDAEMPRGPLAEMREQNRELIESLDELRARQEELAQLNHELADTNRGVVALYAELDEKAEHLRRASEMKTRFLSNMTHELRTPLNSIIAVSRMLQERTDGDLTPEQERQVRYIQQSANALSEIINDLLDLAKVEAGKVTLQPVRFSVADLFGALRGMFKPMLRDEVELVIEDPQRPIELLTDRSKLSQVLRNFVSNALKFTERGSVTVTVALDPSATHATFSVRDTGIGIAPDQIGYIFEEFTQIDSPLQARTKGTGLGLPLSRRLAELLGGHVDATSAPRQGSTFTVTIPCTLPHAEMPPHERVTKAASAERKSPGRVLIVDDDETSRYVMRQAVRQLGGDPLEALNGTEGLALACRDRPELILLDLRMPGMDGFTLLRHLAEDARTAAIPVVIVTSSEVSETDRARLAHATAVLSKLGFSAQSLASVLPGDYGRQSLLPAAEQVRH